MLLIHISYTLGVEGIRNYNFWSEVDGVMKIVQRRKESVMTDDFSGYFAIGNRGDEVMGVKERNDGDIVDKMMDIQQVESVRLRFLVPLRGHLYRYSLHYHY